ncbi:venom protein 302-like isoform X2 [Macrobrachium nipponense]|uniref:venom protein 302-like isoform X2 n=1 Tax=Macrobrachium nipponense TaxID=159736 RepID=UPI0030C84CCF
MNVLYSLLLLCAVVECSLGLTCLPCDQIICLQPVGCPYGYVKGVCSCCDVCAKGPGEFCGGEFNLFGKCGAGLKCVQTVNVIPSRGVCVLLNQPL